MSWRPVMASQEQQVLLKRLELRCGPDWLERVGCSPAYSAGTLWSIAGGMLLTLLGGWPAWWMLVPYAVWKGLTQLVPALVWGRTTTAPRWAHEDLALDAEDMQAVMAWATRSRAWQKTVKKGGVPKTGRGLWEMMKEAELAEEIAASLRDIKGGS